MKVEISTFCDAATLAGGKLNILGAFDSLIAKTIPFDSPPCAVAIRMRFEKVEEGSHKVKLSIKDAEGKVLIPPLETSVQVIVPPPATSVVSHLIANFAPLRFQRTGQFNAELEIDGLLQSLFGLTVLEKPTA